MIIGYSDPWGNGTRGDVKEASGSPEPSSLEKMRRKSSGGFLGGFLLGLPLKGSLKGFRV